MTKNIFKAIDKILTPLATSIYAAAMMGVWIYSIHNNLGEAVTFTFFLTGLLVSVHENGVIQGTAKERIRKFEEDEKQKELELERRLKGE